MKVITTNLLNRFWKNGVLPIKNAVAGKLDSNKVVNSLETTSAGYALDARQGKELDGKITELNSKMGKKLLWSSVDNNTNSVTLPEMDKYNTIIVLHRNGDWFAETRFYRESSINHYTVSSYHSGSYYIYGRLSINFASKAITTAKITGTWESSALAIREVYGANTIV